ncbi:hypothetical protein GCM10010383_51650 [Streptomyces lomondensis]|uniref:Uncharacterized protein n=1 Tax=Streptomyces lomondensis TaxID=68229 RepID=A0ABQ2XGH4_9ACTN|nr:hypothetical protein GCM10010383_51650 [Streptomyces lomondensis]
MGGNPRVWRSIVSLTSHFVSSLIAVPLGSLAYRLTPQGTLGNPRDVPAGHTDRISGC